MSGVKYSIRKIAGAVLSFALIAFVAIFALSCEQTTGLDPVKGLSLSKTEITVGTEETKANFTINAKVDWTLAVTEGSDWITPSVTQGRAGNTSVTLTFAENKDRTSRRGEITITAEGESEPYIIPVTVSILTGVNEWIFDQMKGWYYWNDVVKSVSAPSNSLAYDEFLDATIEALPWSRVQDTSSGESPATIDGMWVTDRSGNLVRDHIYSYIERIDANGTRASESTETTFGFDFEPVRIFVNNVFSGRYEFIVTWVRPGGAADKEGLKRGTWISKFNGADIDYPRYETFYYRLRNLEGGTTLAFSDSSGKSYDITAEPTRVTPILYHDVITTGGGKKVAYLVYNGFETGDDDEFDNELRDVFGEFKSAGATELVLDMRYNPGGYVSSCQVLTSLAANVSRSDTFIKMKRNANIDAVWHGLPNPQELKFRDEANSLKLGKVYVLETEYSASASEMVISALRGVDIEVVHIGATTNGKNVGMDLIETDTPINGYNYEMWPITFKILNAKGFTDYAGGFEPDYRVDEFREILSPSRGVMHELGDRNELLLKAALAHIDGGTVVTDSRTRTANSPFERTTPLADPRRGGAKYVPNYE